MKAITHQRYGQPLDVLALTDTDEPVPGDGEVVVRVQAIGLNAADWHLITGTPAPVRLVSGLRRPRRGVPGRDVAGIVEAVGAGVDEMAVGDAVVGWAPGALAERAAIRVERVVRRPDGLDAVTAAALPTAGVSALQALRRGGPVRSGERILVTGASGGVGTFVVQLAAADGAHVVASCRTEAIDHVIAAGAAEVVDRTRDDALAPGRTYDRIIDIAGAPSLRASARALPRGGHSTIVGGEGANPFVRMGASAWVSATTRRRIGTFLATDDVDDLRVLLDAWADGTVRPVVSQTADLAGAPDLIESVRTLSTIGKAVVVIA